MSYGADVGAGEGAVAAAALLSFLDTPEKVLLAMLCFRFVSLGWEEYTELLEFDISITLCS